MNKLAKVFSILLLGAVSGLAVSSLKIPNAWAEDLDAMIARLQAQVTSLNQVQEETDNQIAAVETQYKNQLQQAEADDKRVNYDAKIAEAKLKSRAEKIDVSADTEVDLFGNSEKDAKIDAVKAEMPAVAKSEPAETMRPAYPLERNPRYVAPVSKNNSGNKRGRRPFTRSDNNLDVSKTYYARRSFSENFGFAKEEEGGVYTGTTEEDVFVFSDNLANYCQIDTKSLDKMSECLAKIIKDKSSTSQSVIDNVTTMHSESLQDLTSHAVSDSARFKNDSSGFEKNVLLPLQEKSSKATDERGDIEVLTLTDMEALKLKNKLLQTYATMLSVDAFRAFGTFEVNGRDLTNIDEEFNAESDKNK